LKRAGLSGGGMGCCNNCGSLECLRESDGWGRVGCCAVCGYKHRDGHDPDLIDECLYEGNPALSGVVLSVVPVLVFGGVALVVSLSKKRRRKL